IEEYIKGRELTVGILGERPLPVIEIGVDKEFYDFKAKYISDTTRYILPARISAMETLEAQRVALAAHRALGCRSFSRVDMILSEKDRQMIVLEVNSIPGFTSHSLLPKAAAAAGINFADLCRQLIDFARNPQGARGPGGESVTLAGAV
ncbi:MAG: D-alanine--D-alanine ligase, partial [Candidatus Omnitrophota bacterium]